jgi:hypothetical protein
MLVLVDERQREALARAEQGADRFDREVEPQSKGLTVPFAPFGIAATPEPHEWILIGIALLALGWIVRARRGGPPRGFRVEVPS